MATYNHTDSSHVEACLYVDGTKILDSVVSTSQTLADTSNFFGMRTDGVWGFQGSLDEASIYNTAPQPSGRDGTLQCLADARAFLPGVAGLWHAGPALLRVAEAAVVARLCLDSGFGGLAWTCCTTEAAQREVWASYVIF